MVGEVLKADSFNVCMFTAGSCCKTSASSLAHTLTARIGFVQEPYWNDINVALRPSIYYLSHLNPEDKLHHHHIINAEIASASFTVFDCYDQKTELSERQRGGGKCGVLP